MSIDEHFLLMILLEGLIFLAGIYIVHRGQKRQTELIESILYNPKYASAVAMNMVFGFMHGVANDNEKAKIFERFLGVCGHSMLKGIPGIDAATTGKPIRTGSKFADAILNIPAVKKSIADVLSKKIEEGAVEATEAAVEGLSY